MALLRPHTPHHSQFSRYSPLGSRVSSSPPKDFQPSSHRGLWAFPQIACHAMPAPRGNGYIAVGMKRALDSETGLPSSSTSGLGMLVLLMPAEVRRSFIVPPFLS